MAVAMGRTTVRAPDLTAEFFREFNQIPDSDRILVCLQCGTCGATCPTSYVMDFTPREVIARIRAGQVGRVLQSNTMWLCTSCYGCVVRCPAQIPITDIMYTLKALGLRHGVSPKGSTGPQMAKSFAETVDKYGRSFEPELLLRYFLRTNPLRAVRYAGVGVGLLMKKRFPFRPARAHGRRSVRAILREVRRAAVP